MAKDIAIFAGTFDPITLGHVDLVKRASQLFNKVIVAVATNTKKTTLFDLKTRLDLNSEVLKSFNNVEVKAVNALLVDFAREQGASVFVRGLRAASDFEFELQMANMNRHLDSNIETIFLTAAEQFSFISSSLINEIAQFGGELSRFVPPAVERALKQKFQQR